MKKIRLLEKDVIEKIAAGEVIQRPASVIKELVENSLDAGAERIHIEFEGGGVNRMEVSDDGEGIPAGDLAVAVQRHATSKITSVDDLSTIKSMGFRGEALPSIAAVSRFTITSRTSDTPAASRLTVAGGKAGGITDAPRGTGTTVRTEDLFYNVPARKKFLKSDTTERQQIVTAVEALALSRPDVGFTLVSGGKKIIDAPASDMKERAEKILGKKCAGSLIDIDFKNPYLRLEGCITRPEIDFPSNRKMFLFVNRRPVSSAVLNHAVKTGCQDFIQANRYPACILNIDINPELVDVNVHPAKKEVRFVNQQGIHEIVSKVIKARLGSMSPVEEFVLGTKRQQMSGAAGTAGTARPLSGAYLKTPGRRDEGIEHLAGIDMRELARFTFQGPGREEEHAAKPEGHIYARFQWKDKYIIGEDDDGILVIDQHTAWERINYEMLLEQFKQNKIEVQNLLITEVFEVEPSLTEVLSKNLSLLRSFGLYLEEFGPNTFKITAMPVFSGRMNNLQKVNDMIDEIVEAIRNAGKGPAAEDLNDELIKIIACRSSVKAGDRLSYEEVEAMINRLNKCSLPHRCPHGRPVIIRITEKELDSKFLR
ncbi:MAG: DNA mismatch repair endonuclease MutL [Elusimicrobia bacterium]|nr:DNA mismatch repair endonuclease MutL [Elusimicrobiota bacterium]